MTTTEFFQLFLYPDNWNVKMNLIFLGIGLAYLLLTGPLRHLFKASDPVKGTQKMFFLLALFVYYFCFGSPLNLVAHELFSMHMLQMSLLYFVMPPLILLGIPEYMYGPIFRVKAIFLVIKFCTRPLITLFLFNGLMSFYHVPVVFDFVMTNLVVHFVSHILLLSFALCMWWPIIAPVPWMDHLKPLFKLALIFANGVLLTPACAMITFADKIFYATYQETSQLAPILSPLHDQQLGGVIMKIIQEVVYITAIGLVFMRWIRAEKEKEDNDERMVLNGQVT